MTGKNNGRPADDGFLGTITVYGNNIDGKFTYDLDIGEVLTVTPGKGNRLDVIFKTIDEDPDGLPVHGIGVGETSIDLLLSAFGWWPDLQEYGPIDFLLERPRADAAS